MKENNSPAAHIVRVVPKAADIFTYKISDTYANKKGFVRLLTGVVFLVVAVVYWQSNPIYLSVLLALFGLLSTVVTPVAHRIAAGKSAASLPTNIFAFFGTKITVNDGKNRLELEWSDLDHIILSKRLLLIFIAPRVAFVVPKDQMGEERAAIEALVKENSGLCPTVYRKYL